MLGLNDIGYRKWSDVTQDFVTLIETVQTACPDVQLVLFGVLPVSEHYCRRHKIPIARWNSFNEILSGVCKAHNVPFINFADRVADDRGYLSAAYADGDFHLKNAGKDVWIRAVRAFAAEETDPDALIDPE